MHQTLIVSFLKTRRKSFGLKAVSITYFLEILHDKDGAEINVGSGSDSKRRLKFHHHIQNFRILFRICHQKKTSKLSNDALFFRNNFFLIYLEAIT